MDRTCAQVLRVTGPIHVRGGSTFQISSIKQLDLSLISLQWSNGQATICYKHANDDQNQADHGSIRLMA